MTKITFMEALRRKIASHGQPTESQQWDAGQDEGCGTDSERAFRRWEAEQPYTQEALTIQTIGQHERIRLLEEWMRETIRAWKTGDIKTAHIQRGQWLLED